MGRAKRVLWLCPPALSVLMMRATRNEEVERHGVCCAVTCRCAVAPVPAGGSVIVVAAQISNAPKQERHQRRWLGLRRNPGRLALAVFRMPLRLYRRGWGWLLGRTFLALTHVGRKTGQPHDTVAMVLADDDVSGEVVICSGWGPDADWVQNLRAGPAREARVGHDRYAPEHRFLNADEAVAVGVGSARSTVGGCG